MELAAAIEMLQKICDSHRGDKKQQKFKHCTKAASDLSNALDNPNSQKTLSAAIQYALTEANHDCTSCCGSVTTPKFVSDLESFRDYTLPTINAPDSTTTSSPSSSGQQSPIGSASSSTYGSLLSSSSALFQSSDSCYTTSAVSPPDRYWQRLKNHLSIARTAILEDLFNYAPEKKPQQDARDNLIKLLILDIIRLNANNLHAKEKPAPDKTKTILKIWHKDHNIAKDAELSNLYSSLREHLSKNDEHKEHPWEKLGFNFANKNDNKNALKIIRDMFRHGFKVPVDKSITDRVRSLEKSLQHKHAKQQQKSVPTIDEDNHRINANGDGYVPLPEDYPNPNSSPQMNL